VAIAFSLGPARMNVEAPAVWLGCVLPLPGAPLPPLGAKPSESLERPDFWYEKALVLGISLEVIMLKKFLIKLPFY
jgi:hypothetical protein